MLFIKKTYNIMKIAAKYIRNYSMDFKDKINKTLNCKMNYIPVKLYVFRSFFRMIFGHITFYKKITII